MSITQELNRLAEGSQETMRNSDNAGRIVEMRRLTQGYLAAVENEMHGHAFHYITGLLIKMDSLFQFYWAVIPDGNAEEMSNLAGFVMGIAAIAAYERLA